MKKADLHLHSNHSDGFHSPTEVIRFAKKEKLDCIALADHNTTAGVEEALRAGKRYKIEVIPAVEIRCDCGEILGYFIDCKNKQLQKILSEIRKATDTKTRKKIRLLRKAGYHLTYKEIRKWVKHPLMEIHTILHLIKGKNQKESKRLYDTLRQIVFYSSGPVKAAKTGKEKKAEKIIRIIKKAKGIPVLAHPWVEKDVHKRLPNLIKAGLLGVEIKGPGWEHPITKKTKEVKRIAGKYKLIETVGSDFHYIKWRKPGKYSCSYKVVEQLKEKLK